MDWCVLCTFTNNLLLPAFIRLLLVTWFPRFHYSDAIMGAMASQITSLTIGYSTVYSGADQRKHQSSASLAFVRGNSPRKWPVMRKLFPFDDVIMSHCVYPSLIVDVVFANVLSTRSFGSSYGPWYEIKDIVQDIEFSYDISFSQKNKTKRTKNDKNKPIKTNITHM